MAACRTGWEWAEQMQAASTLAAGKKVDMEKVIHRDSKRSGVVKDNGILNAIDFLGCGVHNFKNKGNSEIGGKGLRISL